MMKILNAILFFGIANQAMAAGSIKTISHTGMSYPGPSVDALLATSARDLAMTNEGIKACPIGISRILKIRTEINMAGTQVPGYPEYSVLAIVQCK